jgi:hypothetical protein
MGGYNSIVTNARMNVNESLMTPTDCTVCVGHTMHFRQTVRAVGIIGLDNRTTTTHFSQ